MGDFKRLTTPRRCYRREWIPKDGRLMLREHFVRPGVPEWEYELPRDYDRLVNPDESVTWLDSFIRLRPHHNDGKDDHLDRPVRIARDVAEFYAALGLREDEGPLIVRVADEQDWVYGVMRSWIGGRCTPEELRKVLGRGRPRADRPDLLELRREKDDLIRHLVALGAQKTKIADVLGIDRRTVDRIWKKNVPLSPVGEEEPMTVTHVDILERIDRAEARLAETLVDIQQTINSFSGRYDPFLDDVEIDGDDEVAA